MLEYLILLPIFIIIAIGAIAVALTLTIIHQFIKLFTKDDNNEEDYD
jgi:hypothetical protein